MGASNGKYSDRRTNSSLASQSDLSTTLEDFTPTKSSPASGSQHSFRGINGQDAIIAMQRLNGHGHGAGTASTSTKSSSPTSSEGRHAVQIHFPPRTEWVMEEEIQYSEPGRKGGRRGAPIFPSAFDLLPDATVVKVFSHLATEDLCRCAQVCRLWYDLAWQPELWSTLDLRERRTLQVDRALRALTRRLCRETPNVCLMMRRVVLTHCKLLTNRGLATIAQRCPELQHLDLSGCHNISNQGLFEVITHCVQLDFLDISGCPQITCISLSPTGALNACPRHGSRVHLRHLDMSECYGLEDAGVQIIARNCGQLNVLYLRRCTSITDLSIQHLAGACGQLRELSLCGCQGITDYGMREISRLETRLRKLSVALCGAVTDTGVAFVARFCVRLRYFNLRGCQVSDLSMEQLARNLPRLRSLDVGKTAVTDVGLSVVAANCPLLRKLSVRSCLAITDKGLQALAHCCPNLQQLNIQDCGYISVDTYRLVKRLCSHCLIEHTNLTFC